MFYQDIESFEYHNLFNLQFLDSLLAYISNNRGRYGVQCFVSLPAIVVVKYDIFIFNLAMYSLGLHP